MPRLHHCRCQDELELALALGPGEKPGGEKEAAAAAATAPLNCPRPPGSVFHLLSSHCAPNRSNNSLGGTVVVLEAIIAGQAIPCSYPLQHPTNPLPTNPLPTAHKPTAYCLQAHKPTAHSPQAHCLLPTAHCPLPFHLVPKAFLPQMAGARVAVGRQYDSQFREWGSQHPSLGGNEVFGSCPLNPGSIFPQMRGVLSSHQMSCKLPQPTVSQEVLTIAIPAVPSLGARVTRVISLGSLVCSPEQRHSLKAPGETTALQSPASEGCWSPISEGCWSPHPSSHLP